MAEIWLKRHSVALVVFKGLSRPLFVICNCVKFGFAPLESYIWRLRVCLRKAFEKFFLRRSQKKSDLPPCLPYGAHLCL